MRCRTLFVAAMLSLLMPVVASAAHNPEDFPLRVHIFQHAGVVHYWRHGGIHSMDGTDGQGRANLYENGQPRGFDFEYTCSERVMNSPGFETLPARWKKPNREIEILLPISRHTCNLHVAMKDGLVYSQHNGAFGEVTAAQFKQWMDRAQYDPEHGRNVPQPVPQK